MDSLVKRLKLAKETADVRILTIDIEWRPMVVYSWGLFNQFHTIDQIVDDGGMLSFAAKWADEKSTVFHAEWTEGGHAGMVAEAHRLLSEADIVVTYNGDKYDVKKLNQEFMLAGMHPPRPFKSIDLLKTNKARFDLPSRKLDYLAQRVGVGRKTPHTGFQLWIDCMAREPKALALMEKYNRQDVVITEKAYLRLLPWLTNSPHMAMFTGDTYACPYCGKKGLNREGVTHTLVQSYWLNQCPNCEGWSRSTTRLQDPTITRPIR